MFGKSDPELKAKVVELKAKVAALEREVVVKEVERIRVLRAYTLLKNKHPRSSDTRPTEVFRMPRGDTMRFDEGASINGTAVANYDRVRILEGVEALLKKYMEG